KGNAEQSAVQNYRAARILLIKAYRLDNKLDEAEKILKEAIGGWGKNNLEVQFERVHLLDAHKNYGAAATEWNKLTKQLLTCIKEPDIKPRYYEAYFYKVRSLYRYGIDKKEPKYVKQAAGLILALEKSPQEFGPEESKARFLELLAQEKELKDEYERQK